jgi:hypothetical protein
MIRRVRPGSFDWAAKHEGREKTTIERMTMQS